MKHEPFCTAASEGEIDRLQRAAMNALIDVIIIDAVTRGTDSTQIVSKLLAEIDQHIASLVASIIYEQGLSVLH